MKKLVKSTLMKKLAVLLGLMILFGCNKDDGDQCQEDQAKCNGYTYDCETKACLCVHPYEGVFCDEYSYDQYEGMYKGAYVEFRFFETGGVTTPKNEEENHYLYIVSPGLDSLLGHTIKWLNETNFELLNHQSESVGAGSVSIDGEVHASWEGAGVAANGSPYESYTIFKGSRIY